MQSFIENLYYGKILAQNRNSCYTEEINEQLSIISEKENFLTENLSSDMKTELINLIDAYDHFSGASALDSFTMGFKLGAALILDTFCGSENYYEAD